MTVGIPKELAEEEQRVGATPKTVKRLKKQGFDVIIEQGAGTAANFQDDAYELAGASIVTGSDALYQKADIVLKVQAVTDTEIEKMHADQLVLSYLQPAQNQNLLQKLADKKINAVAMDAIPRISRAQKMDVLSSMANIAGYRSVVEAANHFGRFLNGQITAAGKVEPAKVLVIGAGVAGLAAIGTARSLGAIVRAFDTRKEVAEQIESMGASFLTVELDEDGSTSSGYSKVMSKEFIEAEMALFKEQAKEVDIIITTAQIPGRKAPELVLDYHVAAMKPGSVIVDLAASTGGNCTLTRNGEIYTTENGVTIIGKLDQLPAQASQLYGNNLCHLLDDMGKAENFKIDMEDDIVSRAMVTHNGQVNWPPEPLPVSPQKAKVEVTESAVLSPKPTEAELAKRESTRMWITLAIIGAALYLLGRVAPAEFMQHFTTTDDLSNPMTVLACIAILVASINIVGGFFVTHRMLKMFRK